MLTVTVNTLDDRVDANDGVTSLREAIAHPTDHAIAFDPHLDGGRIVLTGGHLTINQATTIVGRGADKLTIDAGGASRVFMITYAGTDVSISGLTLTGGKVIGGGG